MNTTYSAGPVSTRSIFFAFSASTAAVRLGTGNSSTFMPDLSDRIFWNGAYSRWRFSRPTMSVTAMRKVCALAARVVARPSVRVASRRVARNTDFMGSFSKLVRQLH
ncbi:hypothetical protein D9M69_594280 [compost metagenome]